MAQLNIFENRPKLPPIDVPTYLKRLGVKRYPQADLQFLRLLHKAHIYTFPFENLDIHWGHKIILDPRSFYKKMLMQANRGGFCYELNGLFFHLLFHLNFNCRLVACRVFKKDGSLGPPMDHMAIVVTLGKQEWLVDVGFGDSFINPVLIKPGSIQMDLNKYYRLMEDAEGDYILAASTDNITFQDKYQFSPHGQEFIQFLDRCDYHQQSPESHFTKQKIITKPTKGGRVTLTDHKLLIQNLGQLVETEIINEDDFNSKLLQHFGIENDQ